MLRKRKRTNRFIVSYIHYHCQQQRLLRKKKEKLKKHLTNIVASKKRSPIVANCIIFSVVAASSLSMYCWQKNIMIIQQIYVYVWIWPFAIIDWIRTDDFAYSTVYSHSSPMLVKRMNRWRKKKRGRKKRKSLTKNFNI